MPNWPNADIWAARSHNGPITRTVADAALLLGAIAGPDPRDPTSIDSPPDDYAAAVARPFDALQGLRVAWSVDFGYAPVDQEVRRLTTAAAQRFEAFGCKVEAVTPGWDDPRDARPLPGTCHTQPVTRSVIEQRPEWFEPSLAEMIEAGRRISGVQHGQAMLARTVFYRTGVTPGLPSTTCYSRRRCRWQRGRWSAAQRDRWCPNSLDV